MRVAATVLTYVVIAVTGRYLGLASAVEEEQGSRIIEFDSGRMEKDSGWGGRP